MKMRFSPLALRLAALLVVAATAGAYLVSNTRFSGRFAYEKVPSSLRPLHIAVDSDPIFGISNAVALTQGLMDSWNAVPGTETLFGNARAGGSFNGQNARSAFGVFTNGTHEIAFDDDGSVFAAYGIGSGVLGITLKVVESGNGNVLDFLIIVNTRNSALTPPSGSGATRTDLLRGTLLHELGHSLGIGHSAAGLANTTTYGLVRAAPEDIPTMHPFRLPVRPQAGATLEEDDRAAVRFRYRNADIGNGSISGRVRALSGMSVNEIAVRAVGPGTTNASHIGVLSNGDGRGQGRFKIANLPPGGYRVLIETVNSRGGLGASALSGSTSSLGSRAFLWATDEFWQVADTYDPAIDNPADSSVVQVRPSRDTSGVDFVLNASPIFSGQTRSGSLASGDSRVPDDFGVSRYSDYWVFQGSAGQVVQVNAVSGSFTPQIELRRPTDMAEEASHRPAFGTTATVTRTLAQSGVYTIVVGARSATNLSSGAGSYQVSIGGSGLGLSPAPTPTAPTLELGAASPSARSVGSKSCEVPVLLLRASAGSHEELWIDNLVVRGTGTGNELEDVVSVGLVLDRNGNGRVDPTDPEIASTQFDADNGRATFSALDIEVNPAQTAHFLVTYTVDVPSAFVPAAIVPIGAVPLGVGAVIALLLLARRKSLGVVIALLPLACSGGGGSAPEPACFTPFDSAQPSVTFAAEVGRGDVTAFTSAGSPISTIAIPVRTLRSAVLIVSGRP